MDFIHRQRPPLTPSSIRTYRSRISLYTQLGNGACLQEYINNDGNYTPYLRLYNPYPTHRKLKRKSRVAAAGIDKITKIGDTK